MGNFDKTIDLDPAEVEREAEIQKDTAEDPESWDDSKLNKPVKFIYDDDGTEEYFDGDAHGALLVFGAVVLSTLATVGGLIWLFKKAFKG